jgi:hypothetical protein
MGTTTTRFGLTLPDPADNVDITKLNADFVAIDGALGFTPCTSGTRPSTPVSGQAIYESDTHRAYVWDTSGITGVWQLVGSMTAMVATNKIVISTVALDPVTDLVLPVNASTSYAVDGFIAYSSATAADAQLGFLLPSGATFLLTTGGQSIPTTGTSGPIESATVTSGPLLLGGTGVGVTIAARLSGTITTSTAGGVVQATWAQVISTASNTVLNAGSWLTMRRI